MGLTRVAVLGAGGQVGSNLLARLAQDAQMNVWGICRNEITAGPLRMAKLDVRCGSVLNSREVVGLLGDADVVVNCAAATALPARARIENERVIDSFCGLPGARKIIHLSSVAVYGTCIDSRRNTFEDPHPDWTYGIDKLHLERHLSRRLKRTRHEAIVLRMGHVYGAGQWLSRSLLQMVTDPSRRVPFNGALPSNAVHVMNVTAALHTLIRKWPGITTFNLLDQPNSSWRDLFDWHSRMLGLAPLAGLGEEESQFAFECQRRIAASSVAVRVCRDSLEWLRSLPRRYVLAVPSFKQWGLTILSRCKAESLERRAYAEMARTSIVLGGTVAAPLPEPWLLCDGVPGPQLQYEAVRSEQDAREVASWYRSYASPEAILNWHRDASAFQCAGEN